MPRTLTTYKRPALATLLRTAATIEDVGKLRLAIIQGLRSGQIEASDKTKESWDAALWEAVHRIMRERPREAPYVFNFVLSWPKSARFESELRAYLEALVRPLPSDHELYLAELRAREIAARETSDLTRSPDRSKPDPTNP